MGEKKSSGKDSRPKLLLMVKILLTVFVWGFYSQTPLQNTKKPKLKAITRDKFGRKPKRKQNESKRQKSRMVNSAGDMNSAVGWKFRRMNNATCENFAPCQISCSSNFLAFFALLSFWSLICNVEFDSNSSCLD